MSGLNAISNSTVGAANWADVRLFFFNDTATTEIYTLSLHDALPISAAIKGREVMGGGRAEPVAERARDRKSTRLNSSHANISYAVFCLKRDTHTITFGGQMSQLLIVRPSCTPWWLVR